MKKKSKKLAIWKNKKLLALGVVLGSILLMSGYFTAYKIQYYNYAANQAGLVQTRELILLAMRGTKKDAPVEPQTGDIYFPESGLYLPNPNLPVTITYFFDKSHGLDSPYELSVSTYPVRSTHTLYTARNHEELFTAVPKLQACSRGVKIVQQKFPSDDAKNELQHTVTLADGRALFIYLEKDCPELNDLADTLKNIKAY